MSADVLFDATSGFLNPSLLVEDFLLLSNNMNAEAMTESITMVIRIIFFITMV
jgi:hypothetical protein